MMYIHICWRLCTYYHVTTSCALYSAALAFVASRIVRRRIGCCFLLLYFDDVNTQPFGISALELYTYPSIWMMTFDT
jgi:hypothetical protein